jgi:hypothetical protein
LERVALTGGTVLLHRAAHVLPVGAYPANAPLFQFNPLKKEVSMKYVHAGVVLAALFLAACSRKPYTVDAVGNANAGPANASTYGFASQVDNKLDEELCGVPEPLACTPVMRPATELLQNCFVAGNTQYPIPYARSRGV